MKKLTFQVVTIMINPTYNINLGAVNRCIDNLCHNLFISFIINVINGNWEIERGLYDTTF